MTNAAKYLSTAGEGLLDVARRDLAEFDAWKTSVAAGKAEFEDRYRREFLSGEQFRRFDRYREELMDLLELPGAGRVLGGLIWLLRTPYRWTRDYVAGLIVRPEVLNLSEQAVLDAGAHRLARQAAGRGAAPRAGTHPLWKQIAARFETGTRPAGPRAVRPGPPRVRAEGDGRTGTGGQGAGGRAGEEPRPALHAPRRQVRCSTSS